jgi:hypothetical protein
MNAISYYVHYYERVTQVSSASVVESWDLAQAAGILCVVVVIGQKISSLGLMPRRSQSADAVGWRTRQTV